MQDKNEQIRQRAHAIWIEEGQPEGQAEQHWNRAESEFDADEAAATITPDTAGAADTVTTTADGEKAAPSVGDAPEFETPEVAPIPPDVEAITDPATAPKPAIAKKPVRRRTKA